MVKGLAVRLRSAGSRSESLAGPAGDSV